MSTERGEVQCYRKATKKYLKGAVRILQVKCADHFRFWQHEPDILKYCNPPPGPIDCPPPGPIESHPPGPIEFGMLAARKTRKIEQPSPVAQQQVVRAGFLATGRDEAAHKAMLDFRSTELPTLARAALQAAIRHERDLLDLLPPAPATASPRPRRRRTGHAAEAAHA